MAEAKKKTAKKAPAKKAPAKKAPAKATATSEPKKTKKVYFYFKSSRGATYMWNRGETLPTVKVQAVNHIITLDPDVPEHAFAIEKLRGHNQNASNGGAKFVEVESSSVTSSTEGQRLEQFMEMDFSALVSLLGGGIELSRMSKGDLIAKAMKL